MTNKEKEEVKKMHIKYWLLIGFLMLIGVVQHFVYDLAIDYNNLRTERVFTLAKELSELTNNHRTYIDSAFKLYWPVINVVPDSAGNYKVRSRELYLDPVETLYKTREFRNELEYRVDQLNTIQGVYSGSEQKQSP